MNQKSVEKIQTATKFILWFRHCLPQPFQQVVRPYLAQPYQLALEILDCCSGEEPMTVETIAQKIAVNKNTARQVLSALREGGLIFTISATRGWKYLQVNQQSLQAIEQALEKELIS